MALDVTRLGDSIAMKWEANDVNYAAYPQDIKDTLRATLIQSIAEAVVEEITTNGSVNLSAVTWVTTCGVGAGTASTPSSSGVIE